MTQYRNTTMYN